MTSAAVSACSGESLPRTRCGVDAGSPTRTCANEKILAANRANAARSTGPRTRAGKAAVACNALRHALSLPVLADPALAAEVAALARRIAGEGASEARRAAALRIAEAPVDVERIRRVRMQIMTEGFAAADPTARLMRLDRYERRALSRRKSALKAFDTLETVAARPSQRNPWCAVAAAAGLPGPLRRSPKGEGGFWHNKARCRTWQNLSEKLNHFKGCCYRSTTCRRATKRRRNLWAAGAAATRVREPVRRSPEGRRRILAEQTRFSESHTQKRLRLLPRFRLRPAGYGGHVRGGLPASTVAVPSAGALPEKGSISLSGNQSLLKRTLRNWSFVCGLGVPTNAAKSVDREREGGKTVAQTAGFSCYYRRHARRDTALLPGGLSNGIKHIATNALRDRVR